VSCRNIARCHNPEDLNSTWNSESLKTGNRFLLHPTTFIIRICHIPFDSAWPQQLTQCHKKRENSKPGLKLTLTEYSVYLTVLSPHSKFQLRLSISFRNTCTDDKALSYSYACLAFVYRPIIVLYVFLSIYPWLTRLWLSSHRLFFRPLRLTKTIYTRKLGLMARNHNVCGSILKVGHTGENSKFFFNFWQKRVNFFLSKNYHWFLTLPQLQFSCTQTHISFW